MMRFAWDDERFLSFLVLFLFPRSCTHSAGTMFLNVPSGLRPELIYIHESVSRLCRGHAYFLESFVCFVCFCARRTQKQTKCDPVQTPDWLRFSECGAALWCGTTFLPHASAYCCSLSCANAGISLKTNEDSVFYSNSLKVPPYTG